MTAKPVTQEARLERQVFRLPLVFGSFAVLSLLIWPGALDAVDSYADGATLGGGVLHDLVPVCRALALPAAIAAVVGAIFLRGQSAVANGESWPVIAVAALVVLVEAVAAMASGLLVLNFLWWGTAALVVLAAVLVAIAVGVWLVFGG